MAYADQQMSSRRVVALILVAALHALVGYAFISGLAFNVIKKVAVDTKIVDVQEPPPPPEQKPPPPPPDQKVEPPPIVAPPPIVQTQTLTPPIVAPPPPLVQAPVIHETAPPAPPAPRISQAAGAKGDPSQWITNDDYPPGAMREGREGTTRVSWTINEQGKIENCQVTQSSGSPDLDETACRLLTRRGKYSPAKDQNGQPMRSSASRSIRWTIPKD
ncbi:protein TonB [Sphingomonas vulcanisoli]|uniref:Protein TonB n=1 Tax=Sphingomonas vulcanisoli TaxID=1658060 RepID=A0ABX0TWV2_9SPHN|nr:energy transducer TonB [Sphingomonas vulcanisoli]NIJ08096.1 protein TonB [Sphingomonas vulcanisoli]